MLLTQSFQLALINFVIFFMMLFVSSPYLVAVNPRGCTRLRTRTLSFFILLYAISITFAFDSSDFFSYADLFNSGLYKSLDDVHEPIYDWLAYVLDYDYIVWRVLIWGIASFILYILIRKLKLENRNMFLALTLFGFGIDVYTRGILGHIMMLLGIVIFSYKEVNKRFFVTVFGLFLFFTSYFFHKSMYINILFALVAFYPFGKKNVKFSLFVFPLLIFVVTYLVDNVASGALLLNDELIDVSATSNYAAGSRLESNIFGMIGKLISYLPEYLTLAYLINRVLYRGYFKGLQQERIFTYLFRLTFVIMYISSLFYFVETSSWIYIRFKGMAFFPLPFVLAKVWCLEPRSNRWIKWIIVLQIFALFFSWFVKLLNLYEL